MPENYSRRRHHARAHALAAFRATTREYKILSRHHRPDLRGEFAGVRVYRRGLDQLVKLTDEQARFYLDQGAIEAVLDA